MSSTNVKLLLRASFLLTALCALGLPLWLFRFAQQLGIETVFYWRPYDVMLILLRPRPMPVYF